MKRTGWPPCLMQDDSRELSRWFSSRIDAREVVRRVLKGFEMDAELKELLTLAAKACGYEVVDLANSGFYIKHTDGQLSTAVWWAPHIDDGDNARMEGKLGIDVDWYQSFVSSCEAEEIYAEHNNDRQTARRWASLRAAAQIGRGMP